MNSLIRQHHIRLHELKRFVHNYDPANAITSLEWAKTITAPLVAGTLVFLLEPVTPGFNLTMRKEEEENFRVTEFSVVTGLQDNKLMVVNISNNAYEMRFLESLLEEKARKAVIDRKKLYLVMAKSIAPLAGSTLKELERLANMYAKGGSRRSFMLEDAHPNDEPAMALLTALGVHLQWIGSAKQPLDLGSLCHLLFVPGGRQEDSNRVQLQSHFTPIPNQSEPRSESEEPTPSTTIPILENLPILENVPNLQEPLNPYIPEINEEVKEVQEAKEQATTFSVMDSWGQVEQPENFIGASSLLNSLTNKFSAENAALNENSVLLPESAEQIAEQVVEEQIAEETQISEQIVNEEVNAQAEAKSRHEDVYQHLSEALAGLLGVQEEQAKQTAKEEDEPTAPEELAAPEEALELEEVVVPEELAAPEEALELEEVVVPEELAAPEQALELEEVPEPEEIAEPEEITSAPEEVASSEATPEAESLAAYEEPIAHDEFRVPTKLDEFQEPKLVINEMSSLMSKIESQVARAAKKLAGKTAEIEKKTSTKFDALLSEALQKDKDMCALLLIETDSLAKQFELSFDSLKAQLSEKSSIVRQEIAANLADHQKQIEDSQNKIRIVLIEEFEKNKNEFLELISDSQAHLERLVHDERQTLDERLKAIQQLLENIASRFNDSVSETFNNFKQVFDKETQILPRAIEQHVSALHADIESAHAYGVAKLELIKNECTANMEHLVSATEVALSRQIRAAHIEFFLPRLKERKQVIEISLQEMRQKFTEQSFSLAHSQSNELDESIKLARQQLKDLIQDCLNKLESAGRTQQTALEEVFKVTANSLEQDTDSVLQFLKRSEADIVEDQKVFKNIAETYSLDNDPNLATLHQESASKIESLKLQLKNELQSVLDKNCARLENLAENHSGQLNNNRKDLVQAVRLSADGGLQQIKQAIQDAYSAVQAQREKYME